MIRGVERRLEEEAARFRTWSSRAQAYESRVSGAEAEVEFCAEDFSARARASSTRLLRMEKRVLGAERRDTAELEGSPPLRDERYEGSRFSDGVASAYRAWRGVER